MKQTYITIKGKKYLYLQDSDTKELQTSNNAIWNQYGTAPSDIEFKQTEEIIEEDEYVNNYIKR